MTSDSSNPKKILGQRPWIRLASAVICHSFADLHASKLSEWAFAEVLIHFGDVLTDGFSLHVWYFKNIPRLSCLCLHRRWLVHFLHCFFSHKSRSPFWNLFAVTKPSHSPRPDSSFTSCWMLGGYFQSVAAAGLPSLVSRSAEAAHLHQNHLCSFFH